MLFLIDNNEYIIHDLYKLKLPLIGQNYGEEFQLSPIMYEKLTRDYQSSRITIKIELKIIVGIINTKKTHPKSSHLTDYLSQSSCFYFPFQYFRPVPVRGWSHCSSLESSMVGCSFKLCTSNIVELWFVAWQWSSCQLTQKRLYIWWVSTWPCIRLAQRDSWKNGF